MFCKNCGIKLEDNVNFCSSCGENLVTHTKSNVSTPGKGKAISSMVLGIIAITWAFLAALALPTIPSTLQELQELYVDSETNIVQELAGFFLGINLFSLPTGITGLILGLYSKYKSGMRTSGIVTCSLSLLVALISLVIIIISCV